MSGKFPSDEVEAKLRVGQVLMVEGEESKEGSENAVRGSTTDLRVYQSWLDRLAGGPGSGRTPAVVNLSDKKRVLSHLNALKTEAEAGRLFGLVDRDAWDNAECTRRMASTPGLLINPQRQCVESYFCDPNELNTALTTAGVPGMAAVMSNIRTAVDQGLIAWVSHWALWTTLERLNARMSSSGYPNWFHTGVRLPADTDIKAKLREWGSMIEPDKIMADWRELKKESIRKSKIDMLNGCIYSKNVFPKIILPELIKLQIGIKKYEWMPFLADNYPAVPPDIAAILTPLLAPLPAAAMAPPVVPPPPAPGPAPPVVLPPPPVAPPPPTP